jgi:hypothetical protein
MINENFISSLVILPTFAGITAAVYRKLGLRVKLRTCERVIDDSGFFYSGITAEGHREYRVGSFPPESIEAWGLGAWTLRSIGIGNRTRRVVGVIQDPVQSEVLVRVATSKISKSYHD